MILITQPRNGSDIDDLANTAVDIGWLTLKTSQGWRLSQNLIDSKIAGVPYGTQTFCEVIIRRQCSKDLYIPNREIYLL